MLAISLALVMVYFQPQLALCNSFFNCKKRDEGGRKGLLECVLINVNQLGGQGMCCSELR